MYVCVCVCMYEDIYISTYIFISLASYTMSTMSAVFIYMTK